jgi:hypothetical protein
MAGRRWVSQYERRGAGSIRLTILSTTSSLG